MEKTIKINLKDGTFDVEIHGLSLNCMSNLSTLPEEVAENLKRTFATIGIEPGKADQAVSLLLEGNVGIQYIWTEVFGFY